MSDSSNSFIEHLEFWFGKIEQGWRLFDEREPKASPKISVVKCHCGQVDGVTVASTVGLSHVQLHSPQTGKPIRQELFLMMKNGQFSPSAPAILKQVVEERVSSRHAIMRGDAIYRPGSFFEQRYVALYATPSAYYPEGQWTFHDSIEGDINLCWLLPLKTDELSYLKNYGWVEFERNLKADFDLLDLDRPSILPNTKDRGEIR
jgi:hypothetical protein